MSAYSRLRSVAPCFFLVLALCALPATALAASSPSSSSADCDIHPLFRASDFSRDSTDINNTWLPLTPGMQFTLEGRANNGGGVLPHSVVLTVTNLTKRIDGANTVVLWDRDIQDGQLTEAELAFHAQDKARNVWGLGEYPEEFDETGAFAGAPNTWITGQAHAQGGYAIQAEPRLGTPSYLQGIAPSINFLDCGRVFAKDQHVCVPVKCYDHVLVIDETSPLAGNAHQQKFYAPGVGNIQIAPVNDPEGETLVLTKAVHLGKDALADANKAALTQDRHGYQVSEIYRHTPPAVLCADMGSSALSVSPAIASGACR